MRIFTTTSGGSSLLPSGEDNTFTPPVNQPLKNVKKYHRKKAKPKPEKIKPRKAKLPNGKYFGKPRCMCGKLIEKYSPDKKKIRGWKKKTLDMLFKRVYPMGKPMYKKPAPPYRQIIIVSDVQNLMHMDKRPAQRYLTRLRKKIGKPRGSIITLSEFCKNTPFEKEDVIPYLMK